MKNNKKFVVVSLIPTGIQCSVGGYIGDATLVTNKLASVCDYLITNPNAVNGGAFNFKDKNVLYVEGFAIDQLFRKQVELMLPRKNRVGVILESISDTFAINYVLKSVEAFKVIAGVDVKKIEFIDPLEKSIKLSSGQFIGEVKDITPLISAVKKLIKSNKVDAIAISTHIKVDKKDLLQHQKGLLPNPYGLLESLLSHSVTSTFNIPSAHAPMLTKKEMEHFLFHSFDSDPRSSLENISSAYLGSVLLGLNYAPQLTEIGNGDISLKDIKVFYELEDINQRGGLEKYYCYLCEYVDGEPMLREDNEEAKEMKEGVHFYKPMWVDLSELKNIVLYPTPLKQTLIEKYSGQ
jgi:hypothetical protein